MIIKFGDIGETFYVVLKGTVGVYIPHNENKRMNNKEFIEFTLPRKRFIARVNKEPLRLPDYVEILEFKPDGTIDMEALNDFLSIPYRNAQYNRTFVLRNLSNKNQNDYDIDYFVRVA